MPRRRLAALAVAVLLALTGCATIPTSGAVVDGDAIDGGVAPEFDFLASGPAAGASPEAIVDGFMQAALSPQNDFEVARQYLAESVRDDWDPYAGVTIRSGSTPEPELDDLGYVQYVSTTSARIDATGIYSEDSESSVETRAFGVAQDSDDQWRISSLDPGIVLPDTTFDDVFSPYTLYFFDPDYRYLVPDQRWFPATSAVLSRVVRALAAGPAPWLGQGVVQTAFPVESVTDVIDVVPDVVTAEAGVATVPLSASVRDQTTPEQLSRIRQQIAATLSSTAVSSVVLEVDGVPLTVDDTAAPPAVLPSVGVLPLAVTNGGFGFASGESLAEVPGLSDTVETLTAAQDPDDPTDIGVTYAARTSIAAVRAPDGVYRVTPSGGGVRIDAREGLIDPAIDPQGYIWTARGDAVGSLLATDPEGGVHPVSVPSVEPDTPIAAMDISRDGTRLLLYLDTDAGPRLIVTGINRLTDVQLGEVLELDRLPGQPLDATWVGDNSVASLSTIAPGTSVASVAVFDLGGPRHSLGTVDGAVQIVGGNGGNEGLRVRDSEGAVFRPRSASWQATAVHVETLATQLPG
jgi:hypothetical protein